MNTKSYLIAVALAAVLVLWMASGSIGREQHASPGPVSAATSRPVAVQVREQRAKPVQRSLISQGQVEPNRVVEVKAETGGKVVEVLAERGARVRRGQPLVKLAMNDRDARLAKARALVSQREQDYEALRKLADEGFQSRTGLRDAFTALQEARADLEAIKLDIARATIGAPFDGVLDDRTVELGSYVAPGQTVARVVDLDPLKVAIDVPQQDIGEVRPGQPAAVRLTGGRDLQGEVSYISATADEGTRTFRIELLLPNAEQRIPAGLSAEVDLPVGAVQAHFVSPAVLGIGDGGVVGVKTVDERNVVQFHPVAVVRAQADGVWVSGLPAQARLITVGHAYVRAGEQVQAVPERRDGVRETAAATATD